MAAKSSVNVETVASSSLRILPLNSSVGIAIPILGSSPRASGGSREGGRGIAEENLDVRQRLDRRMETRSTD